MTSPPLSSFVLSGVGVIMLLGAWWLAPHVTAKPDSPQPPRPPIATSVPLEVQERCEADAARSFAIWNPQHHPDASYWSHYNADLGRCFMEASDLFHFAGDKQLTSLRQVFDANSGDMFAWYHSYLPGDPTVCNFTVDSGELKDCSSREEWEQDVNRLMGRPALFGKKAAK